MRPLDPWPAVSDVISFRPTPEERELLEYTRRAHGLATHAEALRHLIRKGKPTRENLAPLFAFKLPKKHRLRGRSVTPDDIDRELVEAAFPGAGKHLPPKRAAKGKKRYGASRRR